MRWPGTPGSGSYPVSYPYDPSKSGDVFDITGGSNGSCGNLLCTAGPGWDGPTGLGTPDGVKALQYTPQGDIAGKVTDQATGAAVAGAVVSTPQGYTATTDTSGNFDLKVDAGSYDVSGWKFGYATKTVTGVTVTAGQTVTENLALTPAGSTSVSGTVTDGSGQDWPLAAKITIQGDPHGPVYSDPYTGHYTVNLSQQHTYTLQVTPARLPGYTTKTISVPVGTSAVQQNITVPVDPVACTAPGYADPNYETFTGWAGTTPQDGWTVTDNNNSGHGWEFDDPGGVGNQTGGSGGLAAAFPYAYSTTEDTTLVSPVLDMSGLTSPQISFATEYLSYDNATAEVDLSLDGGSTWHSIWAKTGTISSGGAAVVSIPVPQAAGKQAVQVRFHFTGTTAIWELDNVLIGALACAPVHGGIVAGVVTDANTKGMVNGATVASTVKPGENAVSGGIPGDPSVPGGFYELFSSLTGNQQFTATKAGYAPSTATVRVKAGAVTRQDWPLKAGRLAVSPASISAAGTLGGSVTKTLTLTNNGTAPLHVELGEQDTGSTPAAGTIIGHTTRPQATAWADIPSRPDGAGDSVTATWDGKVYSVGGTTSSGPATADSYVYDPSARQWSPIAPLPQALSHASGAFVDGRLYVAGGFAPTGSSTSDVNSVATVYSYNPLTDSWSQATSLPQAEAAAAAAVLSGQLYIVGGCPRGMADYYCPTVGAPQAIASVYRYDPAHGTWARLSDYPVPDAYLACAGVNAEVVCAGGLGFNGNAARTTTYIYHPGLNIWTRGADMPYGNAKMAYSAVGGKLVVASGSTGVVLGGQPPVTDQAAEYDPVTDTWTTLPNVNHPTVDGSGACGFYLIGGGAEETLPGFDQCTEPVPWLSVSSSQLDLQAGQSATVTVKLDSSALSQPGDYTASLWIDTNSPDAGNEIPVTLQATPPATWGKITGTVTDGGTGQRINAATVVFCPKYNRVTGSCGAASSWVQTDPLGHYQMWVNQADSPVQVSAAADGYAPSAVVVQITRGQTRTADFALMRK